MTSIERANFFDSEIAPLLSPIAEKCKEAGFAFIAVIMPLSGDVGTIIDEYNTEELISDIRRQSIISLLGYQLDVHQKISQSRQGSSEIDQVKEK